MRDLNGNSHLDIALQESGPFFLTNQNAATNRGHCGRE
jgi:hypothetical protein